MKLTNKRKLTFFIAGAILMAGSYLLTRNSVKSFDRVSLFGEGLQTCFYRATQTYTALLWNSKSSPYSADNFIKTTEECFGDLISEARNLELVGETSDFNELASLAHWFHLGVLDIETPIQTVQNKYEALEQKKDFLFTGIEDLSSSFKNKIFSLLNVIAGTFILLCAGLYGLYRKQEKEEEILAEQKQNIEERARKEIDSKDFPMSSRVEHILLEALQANGLQDCKELFFNYHTLVLEGKVAPLAAHNEAGKKLLEKEVELDPFSVNDHFETILDEIHPKLVENKIFYMDDFGSSLELYGNSAEFQKIIKTCLDEGIKTIPFTADKKLINVFTKKLGNTVTLDIEFLCDQPDQNISHITRVKEHLAEKIKDIEANLDLDLNVSTKSKGLSCKGLCFKLAFNIPAHLIKPAAKVTSVRKFKKKDFKKITNPVAP